MRDTPLQDPHWAMEFREPGNGRVIYQLNPGQRSSRGRSLHAASAGWTAGSWWIHRCSARPGKISGPVPLSRSRRWSAHPHVRVLVPAAPGSKDWKTRIEEFNGTLAWARKQPLAFTPGTKYVCSNTNFLLAQAIVAAASGQYYWDYAPQHVLGPAGMTSTGFYPSQQRRTDPRFAHLYGPPVPGGQRKDVTGQSGNGEPNIGTAFSTAPDLLRLVRARWDGTLLPPAWAELMTSGKYPVSPAVKDPDQPPSQSFMPGYGSEERITGGQRAYGHTGALVVPVTGSSQPGGGSTALSIYPDLNVVTVVLSNYFLYPGIGTFLTGQDRIITQNVTCSCSRPHAGLPPGHGPCPTPARLARRGG